MIEDQAKKQALADIYAANFAEYRSCAPRRVRRGRPARRAQDAVRDSATYLTENFHRAPVMMIPCIAGRLDNVPRPRRAVWGSLLPAVWSFMLALRERGLGTAWTTIHLMRDGEQKAAELLGIPYDEFTQAGLFPIAYTIGTDFKPAKRLPLDRHRPLGRVVDETE